MGIYRLRDERAGFVPLGVVAAYGIEVHGRAERKPRAGFHSPYRDPVRVAVRISCVGVVHRMGVRPRGWPPRTKGRQLLSLKLRDHCLSIQTSQACSGFKILQRLVTSIFPVNS